MRSYEVWKPEHYDGWWMKVVSTADGGVRGNNMAADFGQIMGPFHLEEDAHGLVKMLMMRPDLEWNQNETFELCTKYWSDVEIMWHDRQREAAS